MVSDINPEVTNRLVDWLVTKYGIEEAAWKIDYLFRRTDMGDGKYGRPLLPFDGRKTPIDRLEELSDEMQYTMKDIMEREAIADLLERTAERVDTVTFTSGFGWAAPLYDELRDMAAKLRADCERSVPVDDMRIPPVSPDYSFMWAAQMEGES